MNNRMNCRKFFSNVEKLTREKFLTRCNAKIKITVIIEHINST